MASGASMSQLQETVRQSARARCLLAVYSVASGEPLCDTVQSSRLGDVFSRAFQRLRPKAFGSSFSPGDIPVRGVSQKAYYSPMIPNGAFHRSCNQIE